MNWWPWCNGCGTGTEEGTAIGTGSMGTDCGGCLDGLRPAEVVVTLTNITSGLCSAATCDLHEGAWVLSEDLSLDGPTTCGWSETWDNLLGGSHCGTNPMQFTIARGGTHTLLSLDTGIASANTFALYVAGRLDCSAFDEDLINQLDQTLAGCGVWGTYDSGSGNYLVNVRSR